ncbi:autophagy-related protein 23-like, partial [Actinia tenebrosa]|uniref:Autophagy-related protein 23-like n=1 Tax=Actinia tenebrosa TaxID=6105 RepID=A0A6P8HCZ2_ACTTE
MASRKFYLWTNKYEAGLLESYDDFLKLDRPGKHCLKKFNDEDEAKEALEKQLQELAAKNQENRSSQIIQEEHDNVQESQNPVDDLTMTEIAGEKEEIVKGHDDRYEKLEAEMNAQKEINGKFEKEITKNTIEVSELSLELKDLEQKAKSWIGEIKIFLNNLVEDFKTEYDNKIKSLENQLSDFNKRMTKYAKKLNKKLEEADRSLLELSEKLNSTRE